MESPGQQKSYPPPIMPVFARVGAAIHRAMLEHGDLTKRRLGSLVDLVVLGVLTREPFPVK